MAHLRVLFSLKPDHIFSVTKLAVEAFGEINALVSNAGICQFSDFHAVTSAQLNRHISVNFAGPFAMTQAVTNQMIRQGNGGSIISIASITATLGSSQLAHYSATKAALLGMTASCSVALGKYGIRFNCISPGTIETSMNKKDLEGPKRAIMEERVPLRRLGVAEDIARPIVFFASDLSRYVSGQNLIIDGGASVNYQ
jgi:L-rhamnose 1-dehydrogenase